MKKAIFLAATFLALWSCKPEVGEIGPKYPAGEGIVGTWQLTGAAQTDLTLPVPETRDISDYYQNAATHWEVAFTEDGSYTTQSQGPGFDLFGANGTWAFDTAFFPKEVYLTQFDSVTVVLPLGNMPRSIDNEMSFLFSREKCEKPSVSYELIFTRKN